MKDRFQKKQFLFEKSKYFNLFQQIGRTKRVSYLQKQASTTGSARFMCGICDNKFHQVDLELHKPEFAKQTSYPHKPQICKASHHLHHALFGIKDFDRIYKYTYGVNR